ncbi:MAG: DNA-3-methyladenine glycosylase 2 family protein, partial [Alphaproteobacteria bacterium]
APPPRHRPPGYATLARIVVGQQVSARAAATIWGRLEAALAGDVTATAILASDDERLRAAGLSGRKLDYLKGLAEAVMAGAFDPDGLKRLGDEEAIAEIVRLRGFGRWSAKMYLIFALRRGDVWPVEDLGVREGFARIKRLAERPAPAELAELGEPYAPHRSALALLCWHVLHNAPA